MQVKRSQAECNPNIAWLLLTRFAKRQRRKPSAMKHELGYRFIASEPLRSDFNVIPSPVMRMCQAYREMPRVS